MRRVAGMEIDKLIVSKKRQGGNGVIGATER